MAGQQRVLLLPVVDTDGLKIRSRSPHGSHMLGAALLVFLNEPVRRLHNLPGRTVIALQIQHTSAVGPFKIQQGLGIGGPESIDALILIAHHEEIAALSGQQLNDGMLNLGSILGFIHTDIAILRPQPIEQLRISQENLPGIDHLIVIVHPFLPAQRLAVGPVDGWKVHPLDLHLLDFLIPEHLVFHIGNGRLNGFHGTLIGKFPRLVPGNLGNESTLAAGVG